MSRYEINLRIAGAKASPEEVSLGHLIDVLSHIDKVVSSFVSAHALDLPSNANMSLVGIFPGSENLVLSVSEPLVPVFSGISKAISSGDLDELPKETHHELYALSQTVAKRGWDLEIREDRTRAIYSAKLGATLSIERPKGPVSVKGTTTIHARCLRVGGAHPKAELRLPNRERLLNADLSEDLAKMLAQRLYEEVILEGSASWNPDTWEIESFRVLGVTPYRRTDAALAFKELAEAADGRWDGIDAAEYVHALRSDA